MIRIGYFPFLMAIFALLVVSTVHASSIQLGFLAPEDPPREVAQSAYDWVSTVYQTTLLIPDDTGVFKDSGGNARELDDFGVLWLHYSATNQLPAVFTSDAVMSAVLDYLNAGGTMYLSALAVYWVYSLGIETGGEPRIFSPLGKDPPEIGVVPTAEGAVHPIFAGFDTSGPIYFCSMAQDGFTSDFMPIAEVSGVLLATKTRGGGAGAGEKPVIEYEVGNGRIIVLGHHNAVYTDGKSKEGENLRKFTINVIEYLASKSAFAAVDANGKLVTTWSALK